MSHDDPAPTTPPAPCPVCHGPRTWDIDPADTDAEWFAWCQTCAEGEFPSQMHPVQTDPEVSEPHARMIVFTWQLGEVTEHGRTGTAIVELVVSHRLDAKAFTASLRSGVRVPHAGTSYSYQLGQPGWRMSQPIARYSRPRLAAYAARALAALREGHHLMSTDLPSPAAAAPVADAQTLDQIQWMLRDPEWGVGMLEDIADLLRRNGRSVDSLPDPEDPHGQGIATRARH